MPANLMFQLIIRGRYLQVFRFNGVALRFTDTMTHLGHILHCKLDDEVDIAQITSAM